MNKAVRRNHYSDSATQSPVTLLLASLLLAASITAPAHGQSAGAITPGGVEPQIDRRTIPSKSELPRYDIPAVPDRPLDADDGPKLAVKRFRVEGVESISDAGIDQVEVSRLLEELRKQHTEGFTVGQLQEAANAVTQLYRQRGLILALAIVPQQDIEDGVVVIRVLAGYLGKVSTANNKDYSDELLTRPFDKLVGKAVQAGKVESALLKMNDVPGLDAFGVFRPGDEVGETELVLNAKTETPYEFVAIIDNHGVESTGKQRLIGSLVINNPTGNGDRLAITALQTLDPTDSTYGALGYETTAFSPDFTLGFGFSTNDYAVDQSFAGVQTDGDTATASVYGRYAFTRSRNLNTYGSIDFSSKQADVDAQIPGQGEIFGKDKLSVFSFEAGFDSVDGYWGGGLNEGEFTYSVGLDDFANSMDSDGNGESLRQGGSGEFAGGDFDKVAFSLTRLQSVMPNHAFLLRVEGQYSDDLLSSIEQFSMGGPNSVRAYPVSEYIRDSAVFTSIEWIMNAPGFANKAAFGGRNWGEVLQLSIFLDYADGKKNDPQSFESRNVEISGAGLGVKLVVNESLSLRLEAATPLSSQDASDGDNPQYWLSMGFKI